MLMDINEFWLLTDYEFKTEPFAHQREDLALSWDREVFAFFHEMGCGKSKIILDTAGLLYEAGKIQALCVVAQKGVYLNWLGEIVTHLPDRIPRRWFHWSPERTQKRAALLRQMMEPFPHDPQPLTIFLINVEALVTARGKDQLGAFLDRYPALLVVDESTSVKNHKARRTKALAMVAPKAVYRRIMTGTPITQSPLDLYAQCQMLDWNLLGFPSFYAFRARYAEMDRIKFGKGKKRATVVKGYRRLPELTAKLAKFSSRRLKEDCLDLPPKIYTTREVELSSAQRGVYAQMQSEARVELEHGDCTVANVLTQILRLHQISCGFLRTPGGEYDIENSRMDALYEVIEEAPGKVIIWANYRHNIGAIANSLAERYGGASTALYYGETETDERLEAVDRIQNDPECRFFVGNPQTAGYGLTLTACNTVVYYSNSYRLEERLQSEDRAHRIGQHNPVVYVDLVARDTVDERIVSALRAKKNIADEVMGEQWREWI